MLRPDLFPPPPLWSWAQRLPRKWRRAAIVALGFGIGTAISVGTLMNEVWDGRTLGHCCLQGIALAAAFIAVKRHGQRPERVMEGRVVATQERDGVVIYETHPKTYFLPLLTYEASDVALLRLGANKVLYAVAPVVWRSQSTPDLLVAMVTGQKSSPPAHIEEAVRRIAEERERMVSLYEFVNDRADRGKEEEEKATYGECYDRDVHVALVAQIGASWKVRSQAVAEITSPDLLARIAGADPSARVRCVAVRRLSDQALLWRIAKTDGDARVRRLAEGRVSDAFLRDEVVL